MQNFALNIYAPPFIGACGFWADYQLSGCPQSTEKVLGVGILAFTLIMSEKGISFGIKEEFSSLLNGLRL